MSGSKQGSRVQEELEALRSKHLAKSQRDKLKDLCSPLTTPEEAQAFLASMRDKSHQREVNHKPPSNLTADGMDAWYHQQKQREKELRQRRQEAEALLRGYRGSVDTTAKNHQDGNPYQTPTYADGEEHVNEFSNKGNLGDVNKEGEEKDDHHSHSYLQTSTSEEEKKLDDPQAPLARQNHNIPAEFAEPEETIWRDFISAESGSTFPPEANRYHLYLSYACPGSHRALIVRALKGLEDVVSVTYVHPCWRLTKPDDPTDKHRGWVFGNPGGEPFSNTIGRGGPFPPAYEGNEPDPVFGAFSVREIYQAANDTSGKYTIPLLWDTKYNTIVNNDSSDIAYMLNSCLNEFAKNPDLDLYTENDEDGVARLNQVSEWLSPLMIHGVYRCGFAKTQRAYDKAIVELCQAFDRADDILQRQRYLTGDTLTDADIRLFVTLLRFDEVYAFYFKANARLVMLTPSLLNFCREIYQMPGVADTCKMEQIKAHFFGSHAEWNKYSVIPRGLGFVELLEMAHDRHSIASTEETYYTHD